MDEHDGVLCDGAQRAQESVCRLPCPGVCDCCPDYDDEEQTDEERAAWYAQRDLVALHGGVDCPCCGGYGENAAGAPCGCCDAFGRVTPAQMAEHRSAA
jgi:hypothetical protein